MPRWLTMIDDHEKIKALIRDTVAETVPTVVKETLEHYGVDITQPTEVQRDQAFLRSARRGYGLAMLAMFGAIGTTLVNVYNWAAGLPPAGPH